MISCRARRTVDRVRFGACESCPGRACSSLGSISRFPRLPNLSARLNTRKGPLLALEAVPYEKWRHMPPRDLECTPCRHPGRAEDPLQDCAMTVGNRKGLPVTSPRASPSCSTASPPPTVTRAFPPARTRAASMELAAPSTAICPSPGPWLWHRLTYWCTRFCRSQACRDVGWYHLSSARVASSNGLRPASSSAIHNLRMVISRSLPPCVSNQST